jgi:hypothetical protein
MTADEVRQIDDALSALGWQYNPGAARFETAPQRDGDWAYVDWTEVLDALPCLSFGELQAYEAVARRVAHQALRQPATAELGAIRFGNY